MFILVDSPRGQIAHAVVRIRSIRSEDGFRVILQTDQRDIKLESYLFHTIKESDAYLNGIISTGSYNKQDFNGGGYKDKLKPKTKPEVKG